MCYDCGCGMPDDDHGDPKHITSKTFQQLENPDEAKKKTLEALKKEMEKES